MADQKECRGLLESIYEATLRELLNRIESGEATAADIKVAKDMCRDAGIDVDMLSHETGKELAKKTLPFPTEDCA